MTAASDTQLPVLRVVGREDERPAPAAIERRHSPVECQSEATEPPPSAEWLAEQSRRLETASPREIIAWAVESYFPKLTMATADKKEHTHDVPKDAKVTIDGKDAKFEDLKPHTPVKVTMKEEGGKHVITKVEATTKK